MQDGYSQSLLHSRPLELNNGFAGAKKYDRISFHFNEISSTSKNSYFSYDKLVKPLKGAMGIKGNRRSILKEISENESSTKEIAKVGLVYSPKIIINNSILLSPSAEVSYIKYDLETAQKIDEINSLLVSTEEHKFIENTIGLLANSSIGYIGYEFKAQFVVKNYFQHNFQAGYVHKISSNKNVLIDGIFRVGDRIDNDWREYKNQINLAYNYGILYVGAGLNDQKYASALLGVRLINLKITSAYHFIRPSNMTNVEVGIQYVFNKDNKEKIVTPIRKWLIKLKM